MMEEDEEQATMLGRAWQMEGIHSNFQPPPWLTSTFEETYMVLPGTALPSASLLHDTIEYGNKSMSVVWVLV